MIATTLLLSFDTYTKPEITTEHGNLYYIVLANSLVLRFIANGRLVPKNGLKKICNILTGQTPDDRTD
jgi:flagellar biosynthesis GTPase FlhF